MGVFFKARGIVVLVAASIVVALPTQAVRSQSSPPEPSLIDQLGGPETPVEIDIPALRQQAVDRIKSRTDAIALKRPPLAPQLSKLPQFNFDVVFDPDSSLIRPQSYQTIGRLADTLSDPRLLPYVFLVMDHTEATGRRDANLTLSQKRADSIREVLANTFKISPKRLLALGLGEEQLQDSARPASPINARAQIVTIGHVPEITAIPPTSGNASLSKKTPKALSNPKALSKTRR